MKVIGVVGADLQWKPFSAGGWKAARCVRLNFPNQSSFQVRITEISKCDGEDDLQEVMTGVR